MNFEQLRDELIAGGETFNPILLRDLRYADLARAWIGDAGAAACPREQVQAEQERRVEHEAHRILHQRMHPAGPQAIPDPELHLAAMAFIQKRPSPPMEWTQLHLISQAYLLLRCLRTHMDSPVPRLELLKEILVQLQVHPDLDQVGHSYALILEHSIAGTLLHLGHMINELARFRRDTQEFYRFIRTQIPEADRAACSHLEVAGYHCSMGCFAPGADE